MATVDKNFKVKNGLVVEGTTATVNGDNIVTATAAQTLQNKTIQGDLVITSAGGAGGTNQKISTDNNGKLTVHSGWGIDVVADGGDLVLNADGNVYVTSAASGNEVATHGYVTTAAGSAETAAKAYADSLAVNYDAAGAAATAQANAETYTDGKVAALVDSAPELLNTLNEIAAAIADNPNYATDVANLVATKADTSYVDAQNAALDTAAQTYATQAGNAAKLYADGLAVNYDAAGAASTAETNAKTYAKNYADGLASNYDAAGSAASAEAAAKAYADGLASNYDAAGAATAAEGNAKAYADSLAVNYDAAGSATAAASAAETSANAYTDTAIINGNASAAPRYAAVNIGYYSTEVAGYVSGNSGDNLIAYAFSSGIKSGKFIVRIMSNDTGDSQMSEILVTADSSNNVAITEYAIVSTNGNMGDITAVVDGGVNIQIIVSPTHNNSEVMISGTVFVWND